jgi:hypothetical protein
VLHCNTVFDQQEVKRGRVRGKKYGRQLALQLLDRFIQEKKTLDAVWAAWEKIRDEDGGAEFWRQFIHPYLGPYLPKPEQCMSVDVQTGVTEITPDKLALMMHEATVGVPVQVSAETGLAPQTQTENQDDGESD